MADKSKYSPDGPYWWVWLVTTFALILFAGPLFGFLIFMAGVVYALYAGFDYIRDRIKFRRMGPEAYWKEKEKEWEKIYSTNDEDENQKR